MRKWRRKFEEFDDKLEVVCAHLFNRDIGRARYGLLGLVCLWPIAIVVYVCAGDFTKKK